MPLLNGIDAAAQIKKDCPAAKLLFVTMHDNPAYLGRAYGGRNRICPEIRRARRSPERN